MEIVPFDDQIDAVARLHGRSAEDQADRDRRQAQELRRWLAVDDGEAVAVVTAWLRPDDRLFLMPAWTDVRALARLGAGVGNELGRSVTMNADYDDAALVSVLKEAGFAVETVSEAFEVPFASVLRVLGRTKRTSGYSIVSATDVDEDRLFELDNSVRNLVAGTEGWVGDREWFHGELTESPPFDPSAYLVAIQQGTGEYVGLVRVWRNPSGPRLGLVAVLPEHRSTTVAAMLLQRALDVASTWGSESFVTETSVQNRSIHPRLRGYGGVSTGRFTQLTRPLA